MSNTFTKKNTKKRYGIVTTKSLNVLKDSRIWQANPDVINFHNIYNFTNFKNISKLSANYPIVFTLHDMRILTGGCHYSLGCKNYLQNCENCPAVFAFKKYVSKEFKIQKSTFLKMKNIAIVTPSKWLLNEVENSYLADIANQINYIPNVSEIETTNYQKEINPILQIVFIADDISEEKKGLRYLIKALETVNFKYELHIIGAGLVPSNRLGSNINLHGKKNRLFINRLLRESDLLVVPSIQDNFPNVILEGVTQGIAILATNVGGMSDLPDDTFIIVEPTIKDLTVGLNKYFENKEQIDRNNVRNYKSFAQQFSPDLVAEKYRNVYLNLLENVNNEL